MSRGKRRLSLVAKQLAAIVVATVSLGVLSVAPAHALTNYNQGFETQQINWFWGLIGQGSGDWYTDRCDWALTGCGGVVMTHSGATGYTALYTTIHLSTMVRGTCYVDYRAQLWTGLAPVYASIEVLNATSGNFIAWNDVALNNASWQIVGTNFSQVIARDVKIRMMLYASSDPRVGVIGFNFDDLRVHCRTG